MNRFEYVHPASVAEAVAAGSLPGSAYLADALRGYVTSGEEEP